MKRTLFVPVSRLKKIKYVKVYFSKYVALYVIKYEELHHTKYGTYVQLVFTTNM